MLEKRENDRKLKELEKIENEPSPFGHNKEFMNVLEILPNSKQKKTNISFVNQSQKNQSKQSNIKPKQVETESKGQNIINSVPSGDE